ncbi:MAG: HsdR family type I site-specific deoxyribonuclease [archaeon]|nr:HsdR family type I site-specific deoxyribonuclease [archaeon]MCP8314178.1 HsdR family type I site-specific deoxyribonuclease [archaeon]
MAYTEKGTVEDFIIQELQRLGWKYIKPEEMKLKRKENFEEPLVIEELRNALRRINSKVELTDADLDFIIVSLRTIPANLEGIRRFLDIFRNGLVVPLQKEGKERVIKLIDLENIENNEFIVTNQLRVEGLKGNIRADIVLLVNGIPLVLIEGKNPTREEVDWTDAYRQIKRYEDQAPEIFKYVQFSIATDGIKTYYFPNAFREETEERNFLSIWKDPYPFNVEEFKDDILKITIHGLLSKPNLLNIIENFTFIRKERDKSTKIMARYMQFRASNRIFERVINTLKEEEDKKFGLIWHWQGSGKTYTMAFSAWKLFHCPEAERPSIFAMVDRRDLEEQIEKDFSFIEVPIEKIHSIKELIEILKWGREGKRGIFLVTIEKFSPKEFLQLKKEGDKIEIKRENVIVLADEVHRTQYGKFATLMRSIFKNSFIFGFTGTPLSKIERNTFQKFCPIDELYLDRYSMLDALKDGFTVSLSYQARLPQYHLNKKQLEEFVEFEEKEIEALSKEERKELRKKISVIKAFVKKPERIRIIAEDIAEHFKDIVEPTELKAMIVTIDREACVLYKNAIDEFLPSNYSEIVMTFNPNDKEIIRNYFYNLQEKYGTKDVKEIHEKIIESFKARKEPRILIVTDMLITGFDAPNLWTMYLDKPLKEHRLLQAIARTNRPFLNKKFGLINDYIGVLIELERAFEKFEASDAKALKVVIRDLSKEKDTFKELIDEALRIFKSVKREDTHESLENALNVLIDPEDAKKYEKNMKSLMKSYEMLQGDPFLIDYLQGYTWLVKIYVAYYKKFKKANVDELKIDSLSKKTITLIQQTINVKEIDDAYPTVGVDEGYIEILKRSVPKTIGAAIDVITNIQHESKIHSSSPFFMNLSKEVEMTYEELRARKIEIGEAVQRLLSISEKIVEWKREEKEIGKDKYPIYEALKIVLPKIEKQKAITFINNLLTHLEKKRLLFKGWQLQRDVRRKVMAEIRLMLLSEFRDYRSKVDELTEGIFGALEGMR